MVANVVFLILGAVIGIVLGYFIAASRKTIATETDNSELITLRQDFAASKTRVDELTRRLEDAEQRAAGLIQFQTQAAAAQARAQQLEIQLSKAESSTKQNSEVLEILTPIRQQLQQMHDRVDSMERQRAEQHGKLSQQLEEAAKRDDGIATANAEQTTSIIKALVPVRTELEEMQKRVRLMEQQRSAEHANLTEQLKATAKRETELALAAQKSTTGTDSVLGLLKPVQSHLENLGKRIDEMEQQRARQHGILDTWLKQAEQREAELVQATNSLTGALRSRSARGTWGEVELVRVLEAAGMLNHVDFAQQQSIGTLVQGGIRPTGTAGADNDRSVPTSQFSSQEVDSSQLTRRRQWMLIFALRMSMASGNKLILRANHSSPNTPKLSAVTSMICTTATMQQHSAHHRRSLCSLSRRKLLFPQH